jgi:hypothetical protein
MDTHAVHTLSRQSHGNNPRYILHITAFPLIGIATERCCPQNESTAAITDALPPRGPRTLCGITHSHFIDGGTFRKYQVKPRSFIWQFDITWNTRFTGANSTAIELVAIYVLHCCCQLTLMLVEGAPEPKVLIPIPNLTIVITSRMLCPWTLH